MFVAICLALVARERLDRRAPARLVFVFLIVLKMLT
jgi:hypothetical protein